MFDLLVKGGRVIDPAAKRDGKFDVAIVNGRIAAIEKAIPERGAKKVVDAAGELVLPGLIDTHAHVYEHVSGEFGLNPDAVGVKAGVTAVCDQGGPSPLTFGGFRKFIAEQADTDVYCFLSSYLAGGLYGHRYVDLYGPTGINVDAIASIVEPNRDIICGLKCHAEPGGFSRWGVKSLKKAKQASRKVGLPMYVHLGTLWSVKDGVSVDPAKLVKEFIPLFDKGDILAHPFTRHDGGFVSPEGKIHPLLIEALGRGVKLDVGRGAHFSYPNAKAVIEAGIVPDTLGADLHGYNTKAAYAYNSTGRFDDNEDPGAAKGADLSPTFSLLHCMAEMLALGLTLEHVVAMVTCNAAAMMGKQDKLGTLAVGRGADISIVKMTTGRYTFTDAGGVTFPATKRLRPTLTIRKGKLFEPESDLLPAWQRPQAA